MNHKTQSHSHEMTWKKNPTGFTHPSETWLPEGEVCNTHGGPGLWCVILTRVSSLSPQVTDQGWWALAWHQADFACELESLALDLLILEGITGEWRLSFRLSPNEGMQLKGVRLPYYLGFHYKIWHGSWFVILLLKYEAHRGAVTGPGNPKKSISQDMWLHPSVPAAFPSESAFELRRLWQHLHPCYITSFTGLNWVESIWFHMERILGKKTVNQRSNCSPCEGIASTFWPVS